MHSDLPNTFSKAFTCTEWVFRGCSHSLKGVHVYLIAFRGSAMLTQRHLHTLNSIQGVFTLTQRCLCTLNPIQGLFNSQRHSFSCSHHCESCSILTRWHLCALNGCSHLLNGIHVHSMVFRGCSHSLIGIHVHSMGVQGLFTITQRLSHALNSVQGVFNTNSKVFSLFIYSKAQWKCFQICEAC